MYCKGIIYVVCKVLPVYLKEYAITYYTYLTDYIPYKTTRWYPY